MALESVITAAALQHVNPINPTARAAVDQAITALRTNADSVSLRAAVYESLRRAPADNNLAAWLESARAECQSWLFRVNWLLENKGTIDSKTLLPKLWQRLEALADQSEQMILESFARKDFNDWQYLAPIKQMTTIAVQHVNQFDETAYHESALLAAQQGYGAGLNVYGVMLPIDQANGIFALCFDRVCLKLTPTKVAKWGLDLPSHAIQAAQECLALAGAIDKDTGQLNYDTVVGNITAKLVDRPTFMLNGRELSLEAIAKIASDWITANRFQPGQKTRATALSSTLQALQSLRTHFNHLIKIDQMWKLSQNASYCKYLLCWGSNCYVITMQYQEDYFSITEYDSALDVLTSASLTMLESQVVEAALSDQIAKERGDKIKTAMQQQKLAGDTAAIAQLRQQIQQLQNVWPMHPALPALTNELESMSMA